MEVGGVRRHRHCLWQLQVLPGFPQVLPQAWDRKPSYKETISVADHLAPLCRYIGKILAVQHQAAQHQEGNGQLLRLVTDGHCVLRGIFIGKLNGHLSRLTYQILGRDGRAIEEIRQSQLHGKGLLGAAPVIHILPIGLPKKCAIFIQGIGGVALQHLQI